MRVAWLKDLRMADLEQVGGKNASLGEMMSALATAGIRVPGGFATTALAFREFLSANGLEARIEQRLRSLDPKSVSALAACGAEIRSWILKAPLPKAFEEDIKSYYQYLEKTSSGDTSFAVRSSATAEDLPEASFAGQQETFLNIRGIDNVLEPMLEKGRPAIVRRALGSKLEKMVFAKSAEAGRSTRVVETGAVERERFSLTDPEVLELARYAVAIERHYGRPMDIEWAKDGADGRLYVLQSRPETVKSRKRDVEERFSLKGSSRVLVSGRAIGHKIGSGAVRVVPDASQMAKVKQGDVLVTDMTDPNWEPVMKLAAAIVTNRGGRTCHAAIIARELGIPAVVGCGDATARLKDGQPVTVSCAEGDTGSVFEGLLPFEVSSRERGEMPRIAVKIAMNVGNPELAFEFAQLPNAGVGLARLEFIINNEIGVHPRACLEYADLPAPLKKKLDEKCRGYADPRSFFREKMVEGVATIAAAFWPKPVIVRLSDFKSNEYKKLLGGERYEPDEENPMLGFRGAARYLAPSFRECFELECAALKKVRDELGLTNVELMVPFVRTLGEAKQVIDLLERNGLRRGMNGLRVVMMCELPSNAILAEEFLELFDGFSIGSNDLTQLTLGLDRDSGLVAESFDERDAAVKAMLAMAIRACRKHGKYVGICGQGPSDHPDLARWLMEQGIESLSLNPDTVVSTWLSLAEATPQKKSAAA